MTTMKRRRSAILAIALAVGAGSCGSKSGGSAAGAGAAVDACNAYCAALLAKSCSNPLYASVDECKTAECGPLSKAPAKCQGPLETYYHCEAGQLAPTRAATPSSAPSPPARREEEAAERRGRTSTPPPKEKTAASPSSPTLPTMEWPLPAPMPIGAPGR